MTDRERIYNLVDKVCDLSIKAIDKITELKQENNELKQRVAELEKPKKKRKFRAMTNLEFCISHTSRCISCPMLFNCPVRSSYSEDLNKPYQTKDGKYILIEVKE